MLFLFFMLIEEQEKGKNTKGQFLCNWVQLLSEIAHPPLYFTAILFFFFSFERGWEENIVELFMVYLLIRRFKN